MRIPDSQEMGIPDDLLAGQEATEPDMEQWTGWISLQSKGLSRVCSNTTVQKHQFIGAQHSL